jgi:hypothetical protein
LLDTQPVFPQRCDDSGKLKSLDNSAILDGFDDFLNGKSPATKDEEVRIFNTGAALICTTRVKKGEYFKMESCDVSAGLYLLTTAGQEMCTAKRIVLE